MGDQTKKTILVVDDEQDTRIFLSNLLRSGGLRPVIAENKTEGLQKVVKETPDVIILDMMIPGGSGVQMYNDLKRDEKLRKIPVIMLSTLEKKTFFKCRKIRNIQSGQIIPSPDIFLEKPLETEELMKAVNRLINIGKKDSTPGSKYAE
ncbi:MAG: response regulator [Desulfobacterales bacterium]|nr:response regulator [Desulfobacterales bacterium]